MKELAIPPVRGIPSGETAQ